MVLNDPRLADMTLLALAAKCAKAKRQAPDWTVGEGLSSLLRAFPEADGEDREPGDTSTGLGKLLVEARARVQQERR